jgi:hypothetical protein
MILAQMQQSLFDNPIFLMLLATVILLLFLVIVVIIFTVNIKNSLSYPLAVLTKYQRSTTFQLLKEGLLYAVKEYDRISTADEKNPEKELPTVESVEKEQRKEPKKTTYRKRRAS